MEKIKAVGYIKLTKEFKTHIGEILRRQLSVKSNGSIPYILSAHAVLLYDPNLDAASLKASLRLLEQDVAQREIRKENLQ